MTRAHGGEPVEVELVEDDADPDGSTAPLGADDGDRAAAGAPHRGSRARWIGVGVVVALVAVVVGVNVAQARDDAARRAAWAELDWMAPSLAEPLRELWRVPATGIMLQTDGILVLHDLAYAGPPAIRAVDARSGEELWEVTGWTGIPSCSLVGADAAAATELSCVDWSLRLIVEGEDSAAEAFEVVFLDLATGRSTGTVTVPGITHGMGDIEDDLVVLVEDPGGGASVARIATATRSVAWTQRVDIDAPELAGLGVYLDEVSVVAEGEEPIWLDSSTGEPTEVRGAVVDAGPVGEDWVEILPGWRWLDMSQVWHGRTFTYDEVEGGGPARVHVHDPDGSVSYAVEGTPVLPWYDDGQGPEVLVVAEMGRDGLTSGLTGLDGATGVERWTAEPPLPPEACLQVGELMVWCGSRLAVLDVRTGVLLWQETTSFVAPVTDGERLLAAGRERAFGDRGSAMVDSLSARDLRTGELRWSIETSAEVMHLEVREGVVIAMTPDHLIAYG